MERETELKNRQKSNPGALGMTGRMIAAVRRMLGMEIATQEQVEDLSTATEMIEFQIRHQFSTYISNYRKRIEQSAQKAEMDESIKTFASTLGRARRRQHASNSLSTAEFHPAGIKSADASENEQP
jgi:hypothetical protein